MEPSVESTRPGELSDTHMAEPLRSFLFFFLPMVIFQTIAIALSALGLRTRKQTRGGTFAVVGMLIAVVGLVMFVEMFIAGLIL